MSEYHVDQLTMITEKLSELADNSLGFLWLRFHGSQKKMAVCKNGDITLENIETLFEDLPNKMTEDGVIYLESCSTGRLNGDFENNMQFAFAKLTLNKPNVTIIAPSEDSHMSQFSINDVGEFHFRDIAKPYELGNIAVILGEKTKRLLQAAAAQSKELPSIRDSLRDSLTQNNGRIRFDIKANIPLGYLLDAGYDFSHVLRMILSDKHTFSSPEMLNMVRQLIEGHYIEPNYPADWGFWPFFWEVASPLGAAIYRAEPELVIYLLSKGADANHVFREVSLVEHAEMHAQETKDFRCLEILQAHLAAEAEHVSTDADKAEHISSEGDDAPRSLTFG